jgi:hypothetical protein
MPSNESCQAESRGAAPHKPLSARSRAINRARREAGRVARTSADCQTDLVRHDDHLPEDQKGEK